MEFIEGLVAVSASRDKQELLAALPELIAQTCAPDIEWAAAGPAAVERSVYRGHDEVASGFAAIWETWDVFQLEEGQIRDLGDSVLWLGRVKMRGSASHIDLDQEFAVHIRLQDGQVISVRAFPAWQEALEAAGLSE